MTVIRKIIAVAVVAVGCAPSTPTFFVGTWIGHRSITIQPGMSEGAANTLSTVKLVITPSGQFTWIDSGLPKQGEFSSKNGVGFLKVESILNEPMAQQPLDVQKNNVPVRLTKLPDGSIRLYDPKGFDMTGIILTKHAANGS